MARSSHGSITGPIWIAGNEGVLAFPERDWSDFPVLLLAAWIPALQRLSARGDTAECHFMDGPYHFTVTAVTADSWRVTGFETRNTSGTPEAIGQWLTAPDDFLQSAESAARALLDCCDAQQWWNDDTERLRAAVGLRIRSARVNAAIDLDVRIPDRHIEMTTPRKRDHRPHGILAAGVLAGDRLLVPGRSASSASEKQILRR